MSMHQKPLTLLEEAGLIAHGMGDMIGKPSQSADIFRHGMDWAFLKPSEQLEDIKKQLSYGMPFDEKLRTRLTELSVLLESSISTQEVSV